MTPNIENHTKTLVGRVDVTVIANGELKRKPVFLSSYQYDDVRYRDGNIIESNRVILRTISESTDHGAWTFKSLQDLQLLFPLWTSGNCWNDTTVIHPETLALVEHNEFDVVVGRAVS